MTPLRLLFYAPRWASMGLLALMLALSCGACTSTPDPQVQSLEPTAQATQARTQSVEASHQSITNSLDRLESLIADFDDLRDAAASADLPHSLLRLVAINCLNAAYVASPQERHLLDGRPLSCDPEHLQLFSDSIADASTADRDRAHELLFMVDQIRLLRGALRQRLARLRSSASDHLDFIADERARLRRHEAQLEQQRHRFSDEGWQRAAEDLEGRRQELSELQARIADISELYPQWQPRIDDAISHLYFSLSNLDSPANAAVDR